MNLPQVKKIVVGVAIASLIAYLIMGSLTNGESLANPNGIQLAVAPVFLLSAVGSVLTVLTNRLGRILDRARGLVGQARPDVLVLPDAADLVPVCLR